MLYFQPSDNDTLGDQWAQQTRQIWQQMIDLDPELCRQPHAYSLWQWAQCEAAGMSHRVVASPQAVAIACSANGNPMPNVDLLGPLGELSDRAIQIVSGKVDRRQRELF